VEQPGKPNLEMVGKYFFVLASVLSFLFVVKGLLEKVFDRCLKVCTFNGTLIALVGTRAINIGTNI